jgi:hypothetical protein
LTTRESTLVVSAHAAGFVWRNAWPNLGLPQSTMAEAYMRVFPQVTDGLARCAR